MNETLDISTLNHAEKLNSFIRVKHLFFLILKRLFDILVSILGIILMLPVSIFVKIAYMLTGDFKSIFYRQQRIGRNGKLIGIYKFRSMVPNAGEVLEELLKDPKYKAEWDANQKLDNDPRITKVGKLLRKTSLDELPQFINVLLNDMSLIGPRPLVKGELDAHNGNHDVYEKVKPGITGWWACNGRSALDYDDRLKLEYYYVNNRSLRLDLKCILRTIRCVLDRNGAK